MTITYINSEILRAALKRKGIWYCNQGGTPTYFVHKLCLKGK